MELGIYEIKIPFYVESKLHNITLRGEAVPLLVDLIDPMDRCLSLTSILIGKSKTKRVKFINNSKASICIIFDLYDRLPYFSRPKAIIDPQFELEVKEEPEK